MTLRRALPWIVCALALALGVAVFSALQLKKDSASFSAVDITGVEWGKGFALTDHHGLKRTLGDFAGQAVVIFFGYTGCPDMCPTTLALLASSLDKLGADARRVQVLFVTVDPKRDTPEVLAKYVPYFHPSFLGLYGDEYAIARTAKEFKVYFEARPPDDRGYYEVDHSGQVFVFDPHGRLRLFIKPESTPDAIAHDLRMLLEETRL
jgi:protein SCO1/2